MLIKIWLNLSQSRFLQATTVAGR